MAKNQPPKDLPGDEKAPESVASAPEFVHEIGPVRLILVGRLPGDGKDEADFTHLDTGLQRDGKGVKPATLGLERFTPYFSDAHGTVAPCLAASLVAELRSELGALYVDSTGDQ